MGREVVRNYYCMIFTEKTVFIYPTGDTCLFMFESRKMINTVKTFDHLMILSVTLQ